MEVLSVDDLPPRQRLAAWQELVSRAILPVEVSTEVRIGFRGRIQLTELGPLRLSELTSDVQRLRRTQRTISPRDPECYLVAVPLRACGVLRQDDREAGLCPGDIAICDATRPYEIAPSGAFRLLVIMCPRRLLRLAPADVQRLTAVTLSGRKGIGALVSGFLSGLPAQLAECDECSAVQLADIVVDLLFTTFVQHLRDTDLVPDSRRRLLRQVVRFVEDNLHDPGLDPAAIASAVHISTRYVHKLFEIEGTTVGTWIRSRRLEHCRRDLADPAFRSRPVSTVGARWGLADPSRFSRLFRETYQLSPREYRLRHSPEVVFSASGRP
jgi:AraC-like DNA-binding protein